MAFDQEVVKSTGITRYYVEMILSFEFNKRTARSKQPTHPVRNPVCMLYKRLLLAEIMAMSSREVLPKSQEGGGLSS